MSGRAKPWTLNRRRSLIHLPWQRGSEALSSRRRWRPWFCGYRRWQKRQSAQKLVSVYVADIFLVPWLPVELTYIVVEARVAVMLCWGFGGLLTPAWPMTTRAPHYLLTQSPERICGHQPFDTIPYSLDVRYAREGMGNGWDCSVDV